MFISFLCFFLTSVKGAYRHHIPPPPMRRTRGGMQIAHVREQKTSNFGEEKIERDLFFLRKFYVIML